MCALNFFGKLVHTAPTSQVRRVGIFSPLRPPVSPFFVYLFALPPNSRLPQSVAPIHSSSTLRPPAIFPPHRSGSPWPCQRSVFTPCRPCESDRYVYTRPTPSPLSLPASYRVPIPSLPPSPPIRRSCIHAAPRG
ncbi:hypothetical protein CRENBAI_016704 [Crenichthys baileyi]|uniref:Uncharacterized protein n=1 Tax=Crenichthys baileyi TaxID=28760 RepID=A0AAV9RA59_9TELE